MAVASIVALLSLVVVLIALAGQPFGDAARAAGAVNPDVSSIVDRVDEERALGDLRGLSGEEPLCAAGSCRTLRNRLTGTEDLNWAMDYVLAETAGLGFSVIEDPWKDGRWFDRNLILRKTGVVTPSEEVWFVAHVDGVASCVDGRCPAADDNGSGAVAALEMARAFSEALFARSVVLFFSTGEEQGTLGVNAYLRDATPASLEAIHALVNADMIGYDGDDDNAMELYYGGQDASLQLAYAMRDYVTTYAPELRPKIDEGCG